MVVIMVARGSITLSLWMSVEIVSGRNPCWIAGTAHPEPPAAGHEEAH